MVITGKEIMDRWGITAFQLQDVLREGELVAVQDDLIARRTPKSDPCLFCDGQRERETGVTYPARFPWVVVLCEHAPERDVHQLSRCLPPEIYQERLTDFPDAPDMVAKPRCAKRWTEEQRGWRIEAAKFLLFELEAYERANGLEFGGEREAAPSPVSGQDQQVEKSASDFKGPREHAKHLLKENPSKGLAMLEILRDWKLKKFEAAAFVLGRELPDDEDERRRLNEAWRTHVNKLDKGE